MAGDGTSGDFGEKWSIALFRYIALAVNGVVTLFLTIINISSPSNPHREITMAR